MSPTPNVSWVSDMPNLKTFPRVRLGPFHTELDVTTANSEKNRFLELGSHEGLTLTLTLTLTLIVR